MSKHTVFYTCKYAPVELLEGFGCECVYADVEANSFEVADTHSHPNLCGYAKSVLDFIETNDVHEIVLTTCCDAMRRVYDILKCNSNLDFIYLLDIPHDSNHFQVDYFNSQLKRFAYAYKAYSNLDFEVGRACSACKPSDKLNDKHVLLTGAHSPKSLNDLLEGLVDIQVVNTTCTSNRAIGYAPKYLAQDPTKPKCSETCITNTKSSIELFCDWYSKALLTQMPCIRMQDISKREELFNDNQIGVVYHTMKFCDYYPLESFGLTSMLDIPILKLETDGTPQSSGQLQTRIDAFNETIKSHNPHLFTNNKTLQYTPGDTMYTLGVDSGSTSTEAVVLDQNKTIISKVIMPTGARASKSANAAVDQVLSKANLKRDDIAYAISCGYGRQIIEGMDEEITEITCHAKGAHFLSPNSRCVIDIGGQDSKAIALDDSGNVVNFTMNNKCAAGTGRFLEAMARTLEIDLDSMSDMGLSWNKDIKISSMCTVFAESEVISLIAQDRATQDIIHGLNMAVASKTAALVRRTKANPPYIMTGGVAANKGLVKALREALDADVVVNKDSQYCGAIGAAILALEKLGY